MSVTITRRILQAFQQPLEEALGGFIITSPLNQDIEHDAMLIHRAPHIMKFTLNAKEDLVEMPLIAPSGAPLPETLRKLLPNFWYQQRTVS